MTTDRDEQLQFEQLVQKIAPQSMLVRTWQLKGGMSAQMTALEIKHSDGKTSRMIVRRPGAESLKRQHVAQDEFKLLQMIQSLGLATQTPYHFDESGSIFSTPYLVIEYIEGKIEFAPSNLGDFILQFATQLTKIHRQPSSMLDEYFLSKHAHRFADTFYDKQLTANVDTWLDEEHICTTLDSVWPLPQRNTSVLLHGDFWPGNVLWRNEKLVAVIDWEDATVGDPLTDLAISRLDIAWIFSIDAMYSFTRHYQSQMNIDYTDLPYWDLYAALRFVRLASSNLAEWAAFFHPVDRHDITEQRIREHYRVFLNQAFDKLTPVQ
ncbi:unnamed protein product [Didymodactylos carnosus]|uniref:Aminoglycoside phosphotransferase domain-containing protein n=1 Tax=Didymodactylos carnosus TaxID=1234261 RepID=A0A814WMK6_9BILA|nr:unnamed protein product [Didymodactylos carnosus]CAF3964904.1 unnamed protein product [Didymodactylos carnosus]